MNEILRLLQRSLRPFGYDIRKRNAYNLLPFKGFESQDLNCVRKAFEADDRAGPKGDLDRLTIVYRTSLTAERCEQTRDRVVPAPLNEIVSRCFYSLVTSVNAALREPGAPHINVLILDDRSDARYLDPIKAIASKLKCSWNLRPSKTQGQGSTLHEQFQIAAADDGLYYFCEDDYLHEECAIYEMWAFYRQVFAATGKHLVLHPQEHECLYKHAFYPSYLILSPWRHWRTTSDATHHLFLHAHVVRDYWECFENTKFVGIKKKRHLGSERRTTCRLFSSFPCFSPIPGLAAHMQGANVLPPFFDWEKLWESNNPDLEIEKLYVVR